MFPVCKQAVVLHPPTASKRSKTSQAPRCTSRSSLPRSGKRWEQRSVWLSSRALACVRRRRHASANT